MYYFSASKKSKKTRNNVNSKSTLLITVTLLECIMSEDTRNNVNSKSALLITVTLIETSNYNSDSCGRVFVIHPFENISHFCFAQ